MRHSEEWDGSNWVGVLTPDAKDAWERLGNEIDLLPESRLSVLVCQRLAGQCQECRIGSE